MSTTTQRAAHPVTSAYSDLTVSIPGAANTTGFIKNRNSFAIEVIKGGSTVPDPSNIGVVIPPFSDDWCEASNIWVRGQGGFVLFDVVI